MAVDSLSIEPALASICIVTRNRKADLLRALGSCLAQSYRPLEVLVFDDASTDGTEQDVLARFPQVRYFRSDQRFQEVS